MEASYSGNLRVWDGWQLTAVDDAPIAAAVPFLPGAHPGAEAAERFYAIEALNPLVTPAADEGAEPYTLQWFLNIENRRHQSRQGRWIPRLLEFKKHAGETLLGLGQGLGTDWLQYARFGASVIVCSSSAEQLVLARRNFELRGLSGRFVHASPSGLPLESASIDVVSMSQLLHDVSDPRPALAEVYRVLKPGGKVLALAPARFDIDFWFRCCFPLQRLFKRKTTPAAAELRRFTRRELRRLFGQFGEHRIHKRQLRRSEIPHVWRWVPSSLLERLMGRVLVLKAFKPLSAALPTQVAA
jgi:ubiquinone/menaquinone biosynthesis C-methylase UbiE